MFELGNIYATPGAMEAIPNFEFVTALTRHHNGDWGEVCKEDWESNNEALELGFRLLSSYSTLEGVRFWIITEADRSATTILLPEEY